MRQLKIAKRPDDTPEEARHRVAQNEELLSLWMSLGSVGLSEQALVWQPLVAGNAQFVVSLTKQYPHPAVSPATLVRAAYNTGLG